MCPLNSAKPGYLVVLAVFVCQFQLGFGDEPSGGSESKVADRSQSKADDSLSARDSTDAIRQSVVQVYSIRRGYSLSSPWKRLSAKEVSGSGVVISTDTVLTNYHVIFASTDVSISLNGQSERLSGVVEAFDAGLDLALVRLDDPLPEDIRPLAIGERTPPSGTKIQVFGYPTGGQSLSITEGVISRIEHVDYKYRSSGLRTQIDAPLNSGNSGGPVISNGLVVGITFGGLSSGNDIGYAIPCEEIQRLLGDLSDGSLDGKPAWWIETQSLASSDLRRWLKVPEGMSGLRFTRMPIPIEDYPLQRDDVITHIGDFDVSNRGRVAFDANTQVSYGYAVERSEQDGRLPLSILRDGKEMKVEVPLFTDGHFLQAYRPNATPSYFVYGPVVFGVASAEYLDAMEVILSRGGSSAGSVFRLMARMQQAGNPIVTRRFDRVVDRNQELVTVTKLISNRMTRDTSVLLPAVVRTINGERVKNLASAATIISQLDDEFLVIEFEDNAGTVVAFDRQEIERQHEQIMEDNGIVRAASKDLRDVWDR